MSMIIYIPQENILLIYGTPQLGNLILIHMVGMRIRMCGRSNLNGVKIQERSSNVEIDEKN
nr:MAG TPA: hypothetical protein [Bacteriophage sp.]